MKPEWLKKAVRCGLIECAALAAEAAEAATRKRWEEMPLASDGRYPGPVIDWKTGKGYAKVRHARDRLEGTDPMLEAAWYVRPKVDLDEILFRWLQGTGLRCSPSEKTKRLAQKLEESLEEDLGRPVLKGIGKRVEI